VVESEPMRKDPNQTLTIEERNTYLNEGKKDKERNDVALIATINGNIKL
jgi:hypothetical protein